MADFIELKATDLAAMLCSRVCHDLINPVGAIGNGLEVLADPNQAAMVEGAHELIANSAKHARAKLERKHLDMIAANAVGAGELGFMSDDNELLVLWRGGSRQLERAAKTRLARSLVALIAERYVASRGTR